MLPEENGPKSHGEYPGSQPYASQRYALCLQGSHRSQLRYVGDLANHVAGYI